MNIRKLALLGKRQWQENHKIYGFGIVAMAGVLLFSFLLTWHFRNSFSGDTNKGIFLIGLFLGGSLFTSSLLGEIVHPSRGIWLIGLPASAAEKLLAAIIFGVFGYLLAFTTVFLLAEGLFKWILSINGIQLQRTDLLKNGFYNFFFSFVNVQLIILLGSLSFKRASFLKTVILILSFFFITNTANNSFLGMITGERTINGGGLFDYFQFVHAAENVYVHLPQQLDLAVTTFFHYLLPLALFSITWLKFKEAEI